MQVDDTIQIFVDTASHLAQPVISGRGQNWKIPEKRSKCGSNKKWAEISPEGGN